MERMYTESEARQLAVDAARQALAMFKAERPMPACLSVADTAKALDVSVRTIARMKPPKVGGKIPYSWVLKRLEV
jgi:hypothetical protein